MVWSQMDFYSLLCRSVQSYQPGAGLIQQGTNMSGCLMAVALLIALCRLSGLGLQ